MADYVNPDDPHEINNNNYKARPISLIGTPLPPVVPPDIAVEVVQVDPAALAGENFTFSWTVRNQGGSATGGNWWDQVYLSDQPTPNAPGAKQWALGQFGNLKLLGPGRIVLEHPNRPPDPGGSRPVPDRAIHAGRQRPRRQHAGGQHKCDPRRPGSSGGQRHHRTRS